MKLYVDPNSPNARRALLARAVIGDALPVEVVPMSLRAGEHMQPWFLAINPNHKVPVLVDGELCLWESNAIAQYLAHKAGRTDLWPTDPAEQADVSRWQIYVHTHWNLAINPLVYEKLLKRIFGRGEPDPAVVEAKTAEVRQVFALVEQHLATRPWLAAGRLTLADLALAASLSMALPAGLPLQDYPHLSAWFAKIRELDAWKATEPSM
jgi:glutathione S-transferase